MIRLEEAPSEQQWLADAGTEIAGLTNVAEIAGFLTSRRDQLMERARALPGRVRTAELSALIDLVVRRMFAVACESLPDTPGVLARAERSLAVVATGGYGRRELAPYSDVDINFIAASDDDPEVDAVTRSMFRLIMDVFLAEANLKVGYAYRLVGEAAALHHQNQTALLDARFVAGSQEVYQAFQDELRRNIHPVAFIHDKLKERESSYRRRGRSIYRTEPDIKEGEGSLRDLQLASWLAQVCKGFPSSAVWEDIKAAGILTAAETASVYDALEFFSKLRWEMHLAAGKQADSLTVAKQEAVAGVLGYSDSLTESGSMQLMRDYYSHAERVRQIAEKVVAKTKATRLQLEPGLSSRGGMLVLDNPEVFSNDPVAALRAFAYCQRYGLKLHQDVLDALRQCAAGAQPPTGNPEAIRAFMMILRSEDLASTMFSMAHTGILGWFLPEFLAIAGLVPADAAHEYTVGWHSLLVIENCEKLGQSSDEGTRRIFASIRQPELLYLFALVHDMGKMSASGDHSETGAGIASDICRRLGLDDSQCNNIEFLVRQHLLMSNTARLRDLTLRKTVEDFVAVVNDLDLLSMLYIFTVADMMSVGSASWSEMHARYLRELYHRAERAVVNKIPLIESDEDMDLYRRRVRRELSLTNLPQDLVEQHVASMPAMYLLNTSPEEMAAHIEFIRKAEAGEPSTDFRSETGSDVTELTICTLDDPQPGLLSKIAGGLWALDVVVHSAQVFTRSNGAKVALDILYVDFEDKQLPDFKKHQITKELTRLLKGDISTPELLESKSKKLSSEYASDLVEIHDELSEVHSVVDIRAEDQPGLLFRFTSAFAKLGWDIHSARVSTWGTQARDSFYVTKGGQKVGEHSAEDLEKTLRSL